MRILTLLSFFCFLNPALGEIRFEDVSEHAGITRIGESWGNAWGDFDGDGYLDLWATNHRHKPSLYRNNGDGTFTNIIDEVWDANPTSDTHGVAWADFDNDGDQDMIILSGAGGGSGNSHPNHANHFYVNENGLLVERAAEFGLDYPFLRGRTPLWFDSNRDGLLDLLILGDVGKDRTGASVPSALFGQTMGGFENITATAGFQQNSAKLAQYADLTTDGNMEIIVSNKRYPLAVYDTSTIPFHDLVDVIGIPTGYSVQDAAIADFNGDMRPDFFFAKGVYQSYAEQVDPWKLRLDIRNNPTQKGVSFKTEGDVSFQIYSEWAPRLPLVNIGTVGHRVTAFDGGEFRGVVPDLRSATFEVTLSPDDPRVVGLKSHPENVRYAIYVGYQPDTKRWILRYHLPSSITRVEATHPISDIETINFSLADLREQPRSQLLINQGDRFQNAMTTGIFNTFENGCCVAAGDFDNDMDVDIYLVRSISVGNLPNHLYENRGDGTFSRHPEAGGASGSMQGQGQSVTMADYNRDGYLDLFVTNGRGAYPSSEGPDQLFQNIGVGNNWLQIDLEGTVSNRDGIGARLFATTPDGKTQLRENGGGVHWAQQDQKRIHFGLAQNQKVSELVIHWPNGIIQKLKDVPVNQVLRVVEPGGQASPSADVNQDGRVDILDFVRVVKHLGENPPTNFRTDVNRDSEVNILDLVWILKWVESSREASAAPSHQAYRSTENPLSDADTALLTSFYEKIEEVSANATHKESIKRFLEAWLMFVEEPVDTRLHANYPNPFNPETWIPYQLAEDSEVTIRIYDTSGRMVRTLFTGYQTAGYYLRRGEAVYWDGKNELGEHVASGVYVYELETPTFKQTRLLVIVK